MTMRKFLQVLASLSAITFLFFYTVSAHAQQPVTGEAAADTAAPSVSGAVSSSATAPRLVQFSGVLLDATGKPLTGVVGVTLALY